MQLLWLRNDLRLHDHPGFRIAAERGEPLAVVYILPDHWLTPDNNGLNRLGTIKARFLRATLINLHRNLNSENIRLTLISGNPVERLLECYDREPFTLLTQAAQAPEESAWLQAISDKIPTITYEAMTLFSPEQMAPLTNTGHDDSPSPWPKSFSAFRRQIESRLALPVAEPLKTQNLRLLDWLPGWPGNLTWPDDCVWPPHQGFSLNGGEDPGIRWLADYLWESRSIQHYKTSRNQLTGLKYSSHLSPYLAWGALSPKYVWHQILKYEREFGSDEHSYWLRYELLWREYFHWSLRLAGDRFFGQREVPIAHQERWQAWCEARTGIPMVDAGIQELKQSGFVSNRLRQNMASYLIHTLELDWRLGAAFFEQHLIDFDPASNWGNWAYIAGIHGMTSSDVGAEQMHQDHVFDLNWQLEQYDPALKHIKMWLPQLGDLTLKQIQSHQQGSSLIPNYLKPVASLPAS